MNQCNGTIIFSKKKATIDLIEQFVQHINQNSQEMATKNKSIHQGQCRICLYLICTKNGFGNLSPCSLASSYKKFSLLRNGDYFLSAVGTISPPLVPTSSWPWVAGCHGPSLVVISKVPCFISSGSLSSLAVALCSAQIPTLWIAYSAKLLQIPFGGIPLLLTVGKFRPQLIKLTSFKLKLLIRFIMNKTC